MQPRSSGSGVSALIAFIRHKILTLQAGGSSQQGSHHGSDLALAEVAEYLASDSAKLPSAGSLGSTSAQPLVFRPGWEDIFRMNQKQLEVGCSCITP